MMAVETNRYAAQEIARMRANGRLRETSHASKWIDVTTEEMKAFIALVIAMGVVRLPTYGMYWSRNEFVGIPGMNKAISRVRFLLIMQFFHLNDNEQNLPREDPNHNRLFKLRKFMDTIVPLWQRAYYPGREVAVDETLIAFK